VAAAVTHLVMYVDVDFIPSTAARDHILSFYQKSAHVVEQDKMSDVVKEHNILHLVEESRRMQRYMRVAQRYMRVVVVAWTICNTF